MKYLEIIKPIQLVLGSFSFFLYVSDCFASDTSLTSLYSVLLFVIWGMSFLYSETKLGFLHVFTLLQVTIFIFAINIVVTSSIFPDLDYRVSYSPAYVKFSEIVVQKSMLLYSIFISFIFTFYFIFYKKYGLEENFKHSLPTNNMYMDIGKKVMFVSLPFCLIYAITLFKIGIQSRGLIFAAGSNAELGIPLYLRLANQFFTFGFYMVVASMPPQKEFVKYFFLYMIPLVPSLMMGQRGEFVIPIMFFLWYSSRFYSIKISAFKVFVLGGGIVILCAYIALSRIGEQVNIDVLTILGAFVGSSSTSFSLLEYCVQFQDELASPPYPYFLDPLIGGLTGVTGQTAETLQYRAQLGNHLGYFLNPNYFLAGKSTGSSFMAEMYQFGVMGVLTGSLMVATLLVFFEKFILKKYSRMIFMYLFFYVSVFSPRASIFVSIYDLIKYNILLLVSLTIWRFIKSNKRGKTIAKIQG